MVITNFETISIEHNYSLRQKPLRLITSYFFSHPDKCRHCKQMIINFHENKGKFNRILKILTKN